MSTTKAPSADYDGETLNIESYAEKELPHNWWLYATLVVLYVGVWLPPTDTWWLIVNAVSSCWFISKDRELLEKLNYASPRQIYWLIIPVYVWKRCSILRQGRGLFMVYVTLAALAWGNAWWLQTRNSELNVAAAACNAVSTLSHTNDGTVATACLKVVLQKQVSPNNWTAVAQMDNGTTRHLGVSFNPETKYVSVNLAGYTGFIN